MHIPGFWYELYWLYRLSWEEETVLGVGVLSSVQFLNRSMSHVYLRNSVMYEGSNIK